MQMIPFTTDTQLNAQLAISYDSKSAETRLIRVDMPTSLALPDQPRFRLNTAELCEHVLKEFATPELDAFAPYLWLVATPSSANISPLHHQLVKGRKIVVTEDPQLHLVWIYDRIFIKPIPAYILSHAFWQHYLLSSASPLSVHRKQQVAAAARGFLRTYSYLLRHKSDYDLATREEHRLLPEGVEWTAFAEFIIGFNTLEDMDVCPRYGFGELRLTRLNLWSKVLMRPLTLEKFYGQYGEYFARFYGPLLFLFGTLSVALSAMQVELAILPPSEAKGGWIYLSRVCRWFSISTLICVAVVATFLILLFLKMLLSETGFAIGFLLKKGSKNSTRKHSDP